MSYEDDPFLREPSAADDSDSDIRTNEDEDGREIETIPIYQVQQDYLRKPSRSDSAGRIKGVLADYEEACERFELAQKAKKEAVYWQAVRNSFIVSNQPFIESYSLNQQQIVIIDSDSDDDDNSEGEEDQEMINRFKRIQLNDKNPLNFNHLIRIDMNSFLQLVDESNPNAFILILMIEMVCFSCLV